MNLLVPLLFGSANAHVISFSNSYIKAGSFYERIIDAKDGVLFPHFTFVQCQGACKFEFLFFKETERELVFDNASDYRPVCDSGSLKFKSDSPVQYKVFHVDGSPMESDASLLDKTVLTSKDDPISFNGSALWSVVLANCGDRDFVLTGSIDMNSSSGPMDRRLIPFMVVSLVILGINFVFLAIFYTKVVKSKPKVALNHQLYIIASVCSIGSALAYSFLFFIWRFTGTHPLIALLVATVTRAAAPVGLLYVALLSLQYPINVPWKPFVAALVLYTASSYSEVYGVASLESRTTGAWPFGFGVPFADFTILTILVVAVLAYAAKSRPEEVSDEEKRKKFLVVLLASFVAYFVASFATSVARMNSAITKTRRCEWAAFAIHPAFATLLVVCCGWFLWEFNPLGWKSLNDMDYNDHGDDLGLVELEAESDGEIPAIEAKKKTTGKKKTKSDDGFDLDDPFSTDDEIDDGGKLD